MITIDGSIGEGGGQILRTSLALSMVTGKPFRITNIQAKREKPGLLRQHLTAVNAAVAVCGANAEGASIGSRELSFSPQAVKAGNYKFAIGSAGSTTLVFQTILPALLLADALSTLTLEGGTHNPFAPPLDFLQKVFLPLVNRTGPTVHLTMERAGFYPAGGGRWFASITRPSSCNLLTSAIAEKSPASVQPQSLRVCLARSPNASWNELNACLIGAGRNCISDSGPQNGEPETC